MSNRRDLKYYQAKSSALESKVVQLQNRMSELDRVLVNYRSRVFPSGVDEALAKKIENRWGKQSENERRREEIQRHRLERRP